MGPPLKKRARGPIGLHEAIRGEKNSEKFKRLPWDATGMHTITKIYFKTNQHNLSGDDISVIDDLCQYYAARVHSGHIVNLTFIGCADARYYEDYNEKLAQRRIEAVINQILMTLKDVHGVKKTVSLNFSRDVRGDKGTIDHWSHYAEDRRVEIIDTRPSSVDAPKKSEVYTLKDFEDGRLFRADMFFVERWNRQWRKWWPLYYLIKDFEQKDYIHEGKEELIPLSESDLDNIERLLKAIAPHLSTQIQSHMATKGRKEALRDYFFVEFRKAWRKVQDLALKDYNKSDFRYFHEFIAVILGKVAPDDYAKKP